MINTSTSMAATTREPPSVPPREMLNTEQKIKLGLALLWTGLCVMHTLGDNTVSAVVAAATATIWTIAFGVATRARHKRELRQIEDRERAERSRQYLERMIERRQ